MSHVNIEQHETDYKLYRFSQQIGKLLKESGLPRMHVELRHKSKGEVLAVAHKTDDWENHQRKSEPMYGQAIVSCREVELMVCERCDYVMIHKPGGPPSDTEYHWCPNCGTLAEVADGHTEWHIPSLNVADNNWGDA